MFTFLYRSYKMKWNKDRKIVFDIVIKKTKKKKQTRNERGICNENNDAFVGIPT